MKKTKKLGMLFSKSKVLFYDFHCPQPFLLPPPGLWIIFPPTGKVVLTSCIFHAINRVSDVQ